MRFAAAIALLAQGLVSAKEPTSAELFHKRVLTKSRPFRRVTRRAEGNGAVGRSVQFSQSRDLQQIPAIKDIKGKIANLRGPKKCDPTAADVGILELCPPNQYCSDLGLCTPNQNMIRQAQSGDDGVDDDFAFDDDDSLINDTTEGSTGDLGGTAATTDDFEQFFEGVTEDLEDVLVGFLQEFDYYQAFCNVSSEFFLSPADSPSPHTCDCSAVDIVAQDGTAKCTAASVCYDELCYSGKFNVIFPGNFSAYEFEYVCFDFTSPYDQEICYTYGIDGDEASACGITIDGVDCDSCMITEGESQNGDLSSNCIAFDCTNIQGGNAGNDCEGDYVSDVHNKNSTDASELIPVEATLQLIDALVYGITSMSMSEQVEWATLTAKYMVQYYEKNAQDILSNLAVLIDVIAVIPSARRGRVLHEKGDDAANVIFNTMMSYLIDDPTIISPEEVLELPFFTHEDQHAYAEFMKEFASGDLAFITGIEIFGRREAIRSSKKGKKSKKSSKSNKSSKSGKSMKSSKSTKSGTGKGDPLYPSPSIMSLYYQQLHEDSTADFSPESIEETMPSRDSKAAKSSKKDGKRRRQ